MKLRAKLISAILGIAALGGVAVIAVAQVPILWIVSPTGQESIAAISYSAAAQNTDVAAASLRDAAGYSKQTPLTGATITVGGAIGCSPVSATSGACVSVLQLTPAGTISTLTINTPLFPVDGQKMEIFSTQIVTTLSMVASQSQTLNGALTTISSANTGAAWIYSKGSSASNGTWDRYR